MIFVALFRFLVQKVSWWNPVKLEHHAFGGGERSHILLNHVNLTCHNFYVIKKPSNCLQTAAHFFFTFKIST